MAGIDEVLERLVGDGDFRAALARDPAAALSGYDLTRDDIELLAGRLDDGDDAERTVEQRTSKSAMLALLSSFAAPGGGGAADPGQEDQIEVLSWSWGETQDDGTVPDDLAVPGDATDELYNKSRGNVEYSWKVEEGVKGVVETDDLTHKVEPGEEVEFDYNKVDVEAEPVEPAAAAEQLGSTPPDDSNVGGATPDDDVVGGIPPDDGVEATPHQDDMLGARRDATEAVEADDVLEIEDV